MKLKYFSRLLLVMLLLAWISAGYTADWPRWRGIHGDGISAETRWNPQTIVDGSKELFRVKLGEGWSAVSVREDRLYTMGNINNQDIVYCLNPKTGKEVWRFAYDCAAGNYPGPRSTPILDEDCLYVTSREGHVFCLNAESGKMIWKRHVVEELQSGIPTWGFAGSVVIEGDLALINAGISGMAFNKKTGKSIWGNGGIGGYSTPVVFTYQEKRLAAIFGEVKIHTVDVKTGKVAWSYAWETKHHINASDPLIIADKMFISSGYGRGCVLLQMTGNSVKPLWTLKDMNNQFSSSIHLNGFLYGIDGNVGRGQLKCLEVKSGEIKWAQNTGFASLISAAGNLIVLNEKGTLRMVKADPVSYREIASTSNLLKSKCWTAPVLSDGILYLRNNGGELLALDVRDN
ncbi:PQQ-binding-like beta-propeller repeat protein [candidate division KSB1 bacterium]|nr:PQQ-binding-like beta-propeller repeat protein [candidate division KSB1 bacterium]